MTVPPQLIAPRDRGYDPSSVLGTGGITISVVTPIPSPESPEPPGSLFMAASLQKYLPREPPYPPRAVHTLFSCTNIQDIMECCASQIK